MSDRRCDRFPFDVRTRLFLAWLLALSAAGVALHYAWHVWDDPRRGDGNWGHTVIDFGGQWLLGRMILEGHGPQLYHRDVQLQVLRKALPVEGQLPEQPDDDADKLLGQLVAVPPEESQIGGPLYPPVQGLLYVPLALLPMQIAYRTMQVVNQILIFILGYVVHLLTGRRIWWPIASFLLMVFPGYAGAVNLGQNSMLSLSLLLFGWLALAQGRPILAGVLWGFLAFKPVWAVSFLLFPLLARRWRMATAMVVTGALLVLATLLWVGVRSWFDWLAVGREATATYEVEYNWIVLSRDLSGLVRRWLLCFPARSLPQPYANLATRTGLGLWLTVVGITVLVPLWRRREAQALDGPAPAFVLLGAYFSCFHFIYYDALLAVLPVSLLYARKPWPWFPTAVLVITIGLVYLTVWFDPSFHGPPWDTFGLLLVWGWCGIQWVRQPYSANEEPRPGLGTFVGAAR
jgi:hypothetical protein